MCLDVFDERFYRGVVGKVRSKSFQIRRKVKLCKKSLNFRINNFNFLYFINTVWFKQFSISD